MPRKPMFNGDSTQIGVLLPTPVLEILREVAASEIRTPAEHVRHLIVADLRGRGKLEP